MNSETQLFSTLRVYKVLRRIKQPHSGTPGRTPSLFDKCTGFFYMRYTTHGTNGFTSHPKDESIVRSIVKHLHLAQGRPDCTVLCNIFKRCSLNYCLNPHSDITTRNLNLMLWKEKVCTVRIIPLAPKVLGVSTASEPNVFWPDAALPNIAAGVLGAWLPNTAAGVTAAEAAGADSLFGSLDTVRKNWHSIFL